MLTIQWPLIYLILLEINFVVDKEVGKRKGTTLPVVWNMPSGYRIVVKCNENSQPIGDEGAIMGKILGTIARNGGYCPLNIKDWREVKKNGGAETILQCIEVIHNGKQNMIASCYLSLYIECLYCIYIMLV